MTEPTGVSEQLKLAIEMGFARGPGVRDELVDLLENGTGRGTDVAGTPAGTGVSSSVVTAGNVKTITLTLDDVEVAMTDQAGVVAYGGLKVFDFPEGLIHILGASADLDLTKDVATGVINDAWDGDIALGTATASNNATLTGTEANVVPSTSTPQAVAGVTTGDMVSTVAITALTDSTAGVVSNTLAALTDLATAGGNTYSDAAVNAKIAIIRNALATLAAKVNEALTARSGGKALVVDGTVTPADLFLNIVIDDADHNVGAGPAHVIVNGTITFSYVNLGTN
jgi:hypothetical protein